MTAEKDFDKILAKLEKTAEKLKEYKQELLKNSEETVKEELEFGKSGQWKLKSNKSSQQDPLPEGKSIQGIMVRLGEKEKAKDIARDTLKRLRSMKKPKLDKEEEANKAEHDVHVKFSHNGQQYTHTFNGIKAPGGGGAANQALDHIRNKLPGAAISSIKAVPVKKPGSV